MSVTDDREEGRDGRRFAGAGGTPGGVGEFFLGAILAGLGVYLLFNQVQVHTAGLRVFGYEPSFGLTLLPLLLGVGVLFVNGRSVLGWVLALGGVLLIVVGVLMRMDIYFRPTSLWNTLVMLALLAAGLGLIARSVRPHPRRSSGG